MNGKEDASGSQATIHLSETEVSHLLQKAAQQYEKYMRIADLADIADLDEPRHPRYDWGNPIGLVVKGRSSAELG